MLRLPAGATAFMLALGPVLTQAPAEIPDTRQVFWQRSLDDALALAAASSRPLLLAINMDGESASDRIVHENYRDPAFVALTRRCVCLGASVFRHNARDHDDQGHRIPCPRFGEITCGEHIALEPVLFANYLADGERVAPRHALIRSDGTKAFDLSLCFDLKDIDRALAAAVDPESGLNPGVTRANQVVPDGIFSPPIHRDLMALLAQEPVAWTELARYRGCRGRAALEDALARVPDEASLMAALDSIAAHGDHGALDALRVVAARMPALTKPVCGRLGKAADELGLRQQFLAVLQGMVQSLGVVPGDPGPSAREQELLSWLAPAHREAATRGYLLARCAVGCDNWIGDRLLDEVDDAPTRSLYQDTTRAHGGPVHLDSLLQTANVIARAEIVLPRPAAATDAMPEEDALRQQLDRLDAEPKERRDDPEWLAQFAKASLDLGRRHIESGQRDAQLLLEDAARHFEQATAKVPDRYEWWIERARAAYFLQRFAEQVEYGRRAYAIATGSEQLPADAGSAASLVLQDERAIEALRWLGDGQVRRIAADAGNEPAAGAPPPGPQETTAELGARIDALRALGIAAVSPFGSDQDWISFASCCGLLGLLREEQAVAQCGAMRYPASAELRQELNGALWRCGRPELMPVVAEAIERAHAPSAETAWFCGHAWILAAEDARRREDPRAAVHAYRTAQQWLQQAVEHKADYRANCDQWLALAYLGQGMAETQAERADAVIALECAFSAQRDLSQLRDGLGCDVLDLVDRIVEWRTTGPGVPPLAVLDRLDKIAADDPFLALAVSDAALREALRADGRNPERKEKQTVDAAGKSITMPMGLPTAEGDGWLQQSIEAGRRAAARSKTDADKQPLAQSLTIQAERQFERGTLDGVLEALAEAAPLLGLEPPAEDADEAALRALAGQLRGLLGEARPRLREGR